MTAANNKVFWISLFVIFFLHSALSFASYRIFTKRTVLPVEGTPIETTTPEQKAKGEISFKHVDSRTVNFTPMPVVFYIIGGFAALGAAVVYMFYVRLTAA